jgi:hypothetical protein
MCGDREEVFLPGSKLPIPVFVAVGIKGHGGNPKEDGLSIFWMHRGMTHFNIIVRLLSPLSKYLYDSCESDFISFKKINNSSPQLRASILCQRQKCPDLRPEKHGFSVFSIGPKILRPNRSYLEAEN